MPADCKWGSNALPKISTQIYKTLKLYLEIYIETRISFGNPVIKNA